MRAAVCALALSACCATIAPGAASAGDPGPTESLGSSHGLEYMRAKFDSVVSQAGAPAYCDGDAEPTGGGGSVKGDPLAAHLNASYPTSGMLGWQAEGRISPGFTTVTSYAICAGVDTSVTTSSSTRAPGAVINEGLPCTASDATSGGIKATGGDILIRGMFPTEPGTWLDSYQNDGTADASVTASVTCANGLGPVYRSSSSKAFSGETGKAVAACQSSESVAGGGVQVTKAGVWQEDVWAVASKPRDSKGDANKVPDDGWLAKSHNGTGATVKITAFAVCV